MDADTLYNTITKAAKRHGMESEPDHEVGDLQDALRGALDIMQQNQREALLDHLNDLGTLDWHDPRE